MLLFIRNAVGMKHNSLFSNSIFKLKTLGILGIFITLCVLISIFMNVKSHFAALASTTTYTFTIRGGNGVNKFDSKGTPILKPHTLEGKNVISLMHL